MDVLVTTEHCHDSETTAYLLGFSGLPTGSGFDGAAAAAATTASRFFLSLCIAPEHIPAAPLVSIASSMHLDHMIETHLLDHFLK
jgi:hypothetical protein